jgi:hypothetical protein
MVFENKHVIRTETMKNRILGHSDIVTSDTNTRYLAEIGIQQVIQSVLNSNGFYSVANGFFVSLNECKNLVRLKIMLRNANRREESAEGTKDTMEAITFRQLKMEGLELELVEEPAFDELIEDLEADAI